MNKWDDNEHKHTLSPLGSRNHSGDWTKHPNQLQGGIQFSSVFHTCGHKQAGSRDSVSVFNIFPWSGSVSKQNIWVTLVSRAQKEVQPNAGFTQSAFCVFFTSRVVASFRFQRFYGLIGAPLPSWMLLLALSYHSLSMRVVHAAFWRKTRSV